MCISFLVLQICGGYLGSSGSSEKCFRFKNSVWKEYASMKEKRYLAAAVMHNDKLHVYVHTYFFGNSFKNYSIDFNLKQLLTRHNVFKSFLNVHSYFPKYLYH